MSDMQKEIDNAIKALKKMGEKESQRAKFLDAAKDLRMFYQSFIDAGFSSDEAWSLLNNILTMASKN